eukprot:203007_1
MEECMSKFGLENKIKQESAVSTVKTELYAQSPTLYTSNQYSLPIQHTSVEDGEIPESIPNINNAYSKLPPSEFIAHNTQSNNGYSIQPPFDRYKRNSVDNSNNKYSLSRPRKRRRKSKKISKHSFKTKRRRKHRSKYRRKPFKIERCWRCGKGDHTHSKCFSTTDLYGKTLHPNDRSTRFKYTFGEISNFQISNNDTVSRRNNCEFDIGVKQKNIFKPYIKFNQTVDVNRQSIDQNQSQCYKQSLLKKQKISQLTDTKIAGVTMNANNQGICEQSPRQSELSIDTAINAKTVTGNVKTEQLLTLQNNSITINKVQFQVEYLFSDANLALDNQLLSKLHQDKEYWVSVRFIAHLKHIKSITDDIDVIKKAIHNSEILVLNNSETKVRRTNFIPPKLEPHKHMRQTVFIYGLSDNYNDKRIIKMCSQYGDLNAIVFDNGDKRILRRQMSKYSNDLPKIDREAAVEIMRIKFSTRAVKSDSNPSLTEKQRISDEVSCISELRNSHANQAPTSRIYVHPTDNPNGNCLDFSHLKTCFAIFTSQKQANDFVKSRVKANDGIEAMHQYEYFKFLKRDSLNKARINSPLISPISIDDKEQKMNLRCANCDLDLSDKDAWRCRKCKMSFYCNHECQLEHWNVHKIECKKSVMDLSNERLSVNDWNCYGIIYWLNRVNDGMFNGIKYVTLRKKIVTSQMR